MVSQLTTGTPETPPRSVTKTKECSTNAKRATSKQPTASKPSAAKIPRKSIEICTSPAMRTGPPPKKGAPKFVVRASPSKNLRSSPPTPRTSTVCDVDHYDEKTWVEWHASYWTPTYQVSIANGIRCSTFYPLTPNRITFITGKP